MDHLVDRHPSVSPERLIAQLRPPPTFADVSFATYRPDQAEPTQAAALAACQDFCGEAVQRRAGRRKLLGKRAVLPGVGIYLDGGFGVGKTHLLASAYYQLPGPGPDGSPDASTHAHARPKAFATFGELTQLAGVFGFTECIDLLADYTVLCIDEFELDDPGNTTLVSRMLSSLVERGVSVAATSNTLPEQLGEGRFAAQDFLREINTLASIFTTVRIEGPDYRHRGLPPAPQPLSDDEVVARAAGVPGATLDDFDALRAHLATMHPSRYLTLIEGVTAVFLTGVHGIGDQNVALRLVSLTDRLYDAGIPVVVSGAKLDTIFSEEMLAGGYRKKYLRATSRLLALTAPASQPRES
ncbi:cell division protein ZapE [Mycobacterium montefiorense]|uniref:Cell division protein ZapE n=1 Tax=Mycobacterium montefiorense TaxID=154654 RepID=A0AA37PT02_9MYCO|nr:cell division protein ZapE [Mycobacterium montefiorense]GKU37637.1 cell division protein ZapE [Mycobacterium montefiorense]GKU41331.1 cell division protein ZapE [Mycobacterium montefiorense]GKU44447.1 cell division protein ZapE [Mycobacterium montefiorense]GKU52535.1 cell division protein ZapE [Mycobacterium montefiorense]